MLVFGLTGSLGSGKSTVAAMFAARGVPVWDADAAVHRLYRDADVAAAVERAFPGAGAGGTVDRERLAAMVADDAAALARLEAIVHPLVRKAEAACLDRLAAEGRRAALLDIPLLVESGAAGRADVVLVVSADRARRRRRALERGMSGRRFDALDARQLPDDRKRRAAHVVIDNNGGRTAAAAAVEAVLRAFAGAMAAL